jgi:hypothetical protein
MTDNETRARCRTTLTLTGVSGRDATTYDCTLSEGHDGRHQDGDTDQWGITYRNPEGVSQQSIPFVMHVRPVQDQVTDLATRVGLLEAAWTVGGETLSERLDRVLLGVMEQIRAVSHGRRYPGPGEMIVEAGTVTLSTEEYTALLKDREELHALRNAAQADVVTETVDGRCPWTSLTNVRCNLPAGHTIDHITPYGPDHVCTVDC